jgi:hypothetical protein
MDYRGASAPQRLAIGTTGQYLGTNGTDPMWVSFPAAYTNPMTTLGDIVTGGVSGVAGRLGVGSNGQVLTVSAGVPAWATVAAGLTNPMTATGDLISGGASGSPTRLAIGTTGQLLTSNGTSATWSTPVDRNAIVTLTFAAAQAWNVATSENAVVTLTANMTALTLSGAIAGHCYTLMLVQDATGSRLGTFGSSFKWIGGTAPTLSTTANAKDIVVFYYDGTNYNGILNKGFA